MKRIFLLVLAIFLSGCSLLSKPVESSFSSLEVTMPAVPKYGLDLLGAAKYKDVAVKYHPKHFAFGIFTQKEIFGDGYPVVKALLERNGTPLVKYNLRWSDTHSFSTSDFPKIVAEAKRFVPLMVKYPAVHCYVSGATEHKLSERDAQTLANQVLAVLPDRCKYINNPWIKGGGKLLPVTARIINEVHGAENPPSGMYSYSFDGTAAEDSNTQSIKDKHYRAETFYIWSPRFNGHWESGSSMPRPLRKGYPDGKMIRSMTALASLKGDTSFPRGAIYKSHSENKGTGDTRAEKPVIIIRNRASKVMVGIHSCPYYGPYSTAGYYRYYCPRWGYEMGIQPVDVKAGSRTIGKVNPSFRDGIYR